MLQTVEVILYEMREKISPTTFDVGLLMATTTQHINDHKLTEIKVPRTHKPPSRYAGPGAVHVQATIADHSRPIVFQFIDVAMAAIEGRFIKSKGLLAYQQLEKVLIAEEDEQKIRTFENACMYIKSAEQISSTPFT